MRLPAGKDVHRGDEGVNADLILRAYYVLCIDNAVEIYYYILREWMDEGSNIMASVNVTIRMDEDIKRQADDLFSDLGMSLSGAITVFMKQAIRQQAIPFRIARDIPNRETREAIEEVQRLKNDPAKKTYNSFDEILRELDSEV